MNDAVVGIDLASAVRCAAFDDGRPSMLSARVGRSETPTAVSFGADGEMLAGEVAVERASSHMDRTATDVQRRLREGEPLRIDGVAVPPEALAAAVLDRALPDAGIQRAVVSLPALATTRHRQTVRDACRIAGTAAERTVSHSVAASLPPCLATSESRTLAVVALDGRSFDVSVHDVGNGVNEVLASGGDPVLGTANWDGAVVDWLAEGVASAWDVDPREDPQATHRLREAATRARSELATREEVCVELRRVTTVGGEAVDVDEALTRERYESLTATLADRAVGAVERVLAEAGVEPAALEEVHLVGAADEVPGLRSRVGTRLDCEPRGVSRTAVARGLAIQGAVLAGRLDDFILLNAASRGVGIETAGGEVTPLIRSNSSVPTEESKPFAVESEGPTTVPIRVYRSGSREGDERERVGTARLSGVEPTGESGEAVEVAAALDADGDLHVEAEDRATGTRARVHTGAPAMTEAGVRWARWAVLGRDSTRPPGVAQPAGSPWERAAHRPVDLREPRPLGHGSEGDVPLVRNEADGTEAQTDVDPRPSTHDGPPSPEHLERLIEVDDDLVRALDAEADSPADVQAGLAATREKLSDLRRSELSAAIAGDVAALSDDLSRAVDADPGSVERLRRWIDAARRRLVATLEAGDVTRIRPDPGETVDPSRHRVVGRTAAEQPSGTVVAVERTGYEFEGTVERPANVVVSDGPP